MGKVGIKVTTRENYTKGLNEMFSSLNKTEYKAFAVKGIVQKYKIFAGIAGVLTELGWITKQGDRAQTKYQIAKKYNGFDPKDIIDIIKACNSFYVKRKNRKGKKVSIKPNGILLTLAELVKEAENLGESTTKVIYRNKNNHSDSYDDAGKFAHAVITRKVSPLDFEEHRLTHSPREIFIARITGGKTLTVADEKAALAFANIVADMNCKNSTNGFKKRCDDLQKKIAKVEGVLEKTQLVDELCKLYITYKIKPGNRFMHIERYKTLLSEQNT